MLLAHITFAEMLLFSIILYSFIFFFLYYLYYHSFIFRLSLAEDAGGLFDPETGILEAPMVVRVADQTRPVPFVVNAVVTTSDLEFDQSSINFGNCSVYESVVYTVKLTNRSILPQLYGFVGTPDVSR